MGTRRHSIQPKPSRGAPGAIRLEVFARNIMDAGGTKDLNELEVGARAGLTIFLMPHIVHNGVE